MVCCIDDTNVRIEDLSLFVYWIYLIPTNPTWNLIYALCIKGLYRVWTP